MISSTNALETNEVWPYEDDAARALFALEKRDAFGAATVRPLPWLRQFQAESSLGEETLWARILADFRQRRLLEWLHPGTVIHDRLFSCFGYVRDEACQPLRVEAAASPQAVRMVAVDLPPESRAAPLGHDYRAALTATALPGEEEIPRLDAALTDALTAWLAASGLDRLLGVTRVLSIGSTARGTVASLPVDFDLMVQTRLSRREMDLDLLRPRLEDFAPVASGLLGRKLTLGEWGPRGEETVVARYRQGETVWVDVTLGCTPRPADYAHWMAEYLGRLPEGLRARQIAEIRLAKRLFQAVGGVYGSADAGLRPITIEQWVIQGWRYRASGLPVGTADGLFSHLREEGLPDFAGYRARWPVWRPMGGWEIPRQINLFNLLANGDAGAAEQKWERILGFAKGYGEKGLP